MKDPKAPLVQQTSVVNEINESNVLHNNQIFDTTANSLDALLCDILDRDMHSVGLINVFKHLEPWITSINDNERERSVRSLSNLLNHYANNFKLNPNDVSPY
jgi:hypothetical protein